MNLRQLAAQARRTAVGAQIAAVFEGHVRHVLSLDFHAGHGAAHGENGNGPVVLDGRGRARQPPRR
jgi:hypothetical protein